MRPRIEIQPDFLHDLLVLASRPATRLDSLLHLFLEKALAMTSSDVGGGLFLFETSDEHRLTACVLRGEFADTSAKLLESWRQNPRSPAFLVLRSGTPHLSDDHHHDPAHFPLLAGSRSSLWVPLLDEGKAIGVLSVESSEPRHYNEPHVHQLRALADEAVTAIERLRLRERLTQAGASVDLVGTSPAFLELERHIKRAAAHGTGPVVITGERGSGKELTAWAIHSLSERRDKRFVPVLASAFAESLFADELFGHERHAFTGAGRERQGKFQAAEGGTLFFDEIADMPVPVQAALLRVLEHGELPRVGRDLPLKVNVRVIAATNKDLAKLIEEGRFLEDLYDRLSLFEIRVPPLRERRKDIPLLASHFLRKYCQELRRPVMFGEVCTACRQAESAIVTGTELTVSERVGCATAEFYEMLAAYDWPGNVRELENFIKRLLATVHGEPLNVNHLPEKMQRRFAKASEPAAEDLTLDAAIKTHIERVLRLTNNNQSQAAKILGVPYSTLQNKIKKLGIAIKQR